jgi:hypothetical protein
VKSLIVGPQAHPYTAVIMLNHEAPVWQDREIPTTYTIDVHEPARDYSVLPASDSANEDYLEWFNGLKEPLHDAIRAGHGRAAERLDRRRIDVTELSESVAHITGAPPYSVSRVVVAHDMRSEPAYQAAIASGFFDRAMKFGATGRACSQFIYTMHFVRLRADYVNKGPRAEVIDSVANSLGHAALAPITYAHIDREGDGPNVFHWYGYSWRYDDAYYGELINEASAARIAAAVRQELGIRNRGSAESGNLSGIYRERKGFPHGSIGAVALDIMNQKLGQADRFGIYRPIWKFMLEGQPDDAREELGEQVMKATGGQVRLEDIEATPYSTRGMSLELLEKIEEACEVEGAKRPSRLIRHAGVA